MNIGKLNRRVQLHVHSSGGTGTSRKDVYTPSQSMWANVQYISDGERIRAASVQKKSVIRVTVRNSKAITISNLDRMSIDGIVYGIDGVKPNEERTFLEITLASIK